MTSGSESVCFNWPKLPSTFGRNVNIIDYFHSRQANMSSFYTRYSHVMYIQGYRIQIYVYSLEKYTVFITMK